MHRLVDEDNEDRLTLLEELSVLVVTVGLEDSSVEELVSQALRIPIEQIVISAPFLDTFEKLVLNLASSHAAYVEPCLYALSNSFILDPEEHETARNRILGWILQILDLHLTVERPYMLWIAKKFPHHRKRAVELRAYSRSILRIVELTSSHFLTERILNLMVLKVTAVDAEASSAFEELNESYHEMLGEKMDLMLSEFLIFTQRNIIDEEPRSRMIFDHLVSSFERIVLPVDRPHSAPYILFLACACGHGYLKVMDERLRATFFDAEIPEAIRCSALLYSAGLVGRLKQADEMLILRWITSIVSFLHSYVDACEDEVTSTIDADTHHLFYVAFGALMFMLISRVKLLLSTRSTNVETIRQMRLVRLIRSSLNPLRLQHDALTEAFTHAMFSSDILDCTDVLTRNKNVILTTRAKFGRRNALKLDFPFENCSLPMASQLINTHRTDEYIPLLHKDNSVSTCEPTTIDAPFDTPMSEPVPLA